MNAWASLFAGPGVAALVLAVLAAETIVLALLPATRPAWSRLVPMLAAGFFLALALYAALAGAAWPWLAVALAGALVAHVVDLVARLRGG